MNITYRPIDRWPGEQTKNRQASPFSAAWNDTLDQLDRELRHLRARNVVFQIALREEDFRRDGHPKANARVSHPGVVIAFESKYGPLKYATDVFTDYQANVRAIALGLEALRRVDRYGITKRGEQYTGWKALGAGGAEPAMSVEAAAEFIVRAALRKHPGADVSVGSVARFADYFAQAYRLAAGVLHPDVGGSTEDFQRLQEAKRVLDAHHAGGRHG